MQPYNPYMQQQLPMHPTVYNGTGQQDERFFPILLPFVAGLAVGPLLFNRPYYRPPYYPPPPAYVPYPVYTPYPYPYPQPYPANNASSETINIYTRNLSN